MLFRSNLTKRQRFVTELEETWWRLWYTQVFDTLFPRGKWKYVQNNLKPGDICLKAWHSSLGKSRYVICKVSRVETDEAGVVRTAWVLSRPKDSREPSLPYKSKHLVEERVPIQRLVMICEGSKLSDEPTSVEDNN